MPPKKSDGKKTFLIRKENRTIVEKIILSSEKLMTEIKEGKTDTDSSELESLKITLKEKKDKLRELDSQVLDLLTEEEEEIGVDIAESTELEQKMNKYLIKIDKCLSVTQQTTEPINYSDNHDKDKESHQKLLPKLPKLTLKPFRGDPKEWLSFWDSFDSAINQNPRLSDVDKFNYLKSLVLDLAESRIAGLAVVGDNYQEAVKLLKDKFGNKQIIISSHMDALLNISSIEHVKDITAVRSFYDSIEFHIRNLRNLGVTSESYGTLLVSLIINKLPEELKLWISRKTENWNVDELMSVLKTEIEARERLVPINKTQSLRNPSTINKTNSTFSGYKNKPSTASTLFSGHDKNLIHCVFCAQQHRSFDCNVVTDINARRAVLRRKNKCFLCLRSGHIMRDCEKRNYNCFLCGGKHNKAICEYTNQSAPRQNTYGQNNYGYQQQPSSSTTYRPYTNSRQYSKPMEKPMETQAKSVTLNLSTNNAENILLQTAIGNVSDPESQIEMSANIVFDSCSQRTYCTEKLRQSLKLKTIGRENLLVKAFGDSSPRLKICDIVQLAVKCKDNLLIYVKAYCVETICSPISNQLTNITDNYHHLQGLELANASSKSSFNVEILIGADFYWNFISGEVRRGESSGPVAVLSRLGWILSGPVFRDSKCSMTESSSVCLTDTHVLHVGLEINEINPDCDSLKTELKRFWELDSIGILPQETNVMSEFVNDIKFDNIENKYKVKLPFKEEHPMLCDNYSVCVKRLNNLLKKLQKTPDVLKEYDNIIKEQLNSGVIEKVTFDSNCNVEPGNIYYSPHRGVVKLDRDTTKIRIVYNASSKIDGLSLNDCLYSGPSLNPLIFDTLIRFRLYAIAFIADIQKAFLNISIANEHRDFLRFVWVDDPLSEHPNIVVYRFNRVVFGVTSSPFILNATIRHHLYNYFENDDFVQFVLKSLYVDDLACGSNNTESAFDICRQLKLCMKKGGFNLRKWNSNSQELMNMINDCKEFADLHSNDIKSSNPVMFEDNCGYYNYMYSASNDCSTNVLGIRWECISDTFSFDFTQMLEYITEIKCITKRLVLSFTAKFFDPLGLIAPIVVLFKMYFQKLCENNIDWDESLDKDFVKLWTTSINDLRHVKDITVKRCICTEVSNAASLQFHVFADASNRAFGTCVYLRCEHFDKTIHCNLIAAKSRLAPVKKQTIPRLELLACLTAARLLKCVKEAVSDLIDIPVYYWTDSQVALAWIQNSTKEYKQFVDNRVRDIRKLTDIDSWHYCPTRENPADILSRGCSATNLVDNRLWWQGPLFLLETVDNWPNAKIEPIIDDNFLSEVKKSTVCINVIAVIENIENVIDISKFSSLSKLLRVTAYVLRFVNVLRHKLQYTTYQVNFEEISQAEIMWLKSIQNTSCKGDKFVQRKQTLNIKQDDKGILRCYGRIGNSDLHFNCKNPIILPENHCYTKLLIEKCHSEVRHNGTVETLVQLRQRYWLCRGRQIIKNVISKCLTCKRLEGKSYGTPLPPPLPAFRLSDNFAFHNVGVDYAGPLYVKDIYSNSQDMHKTFIALYTCASSRAIHLDLVPDASSASFIRSLKRFIARRGTPTLINSDNSLTFKNADLSVFIQDRKINWRYNVERSPWWGGYFERLVKSTKRCLKKSLGNARLTYEELLTLLVDIEGVLNSRPLTYISDELIEPLTPSHLVMGRRVLTNPSCDIDSVNHSVNASEFQKRHKYMQTILSHYWKRWGKEYVTGLREYHRAVKKSGPSISEGDVVLVYDEKIPRLNWELAVVQKLLIGRDNQPRSAIVRVHNKPGKIVDMNRPIQKLYPLELANDQ